MKFDCATDKVYETTKNIIFLAFSILLFNILFSELLQALVFNNNLNF